MIGQVMREVNRYFPRTFENVSVVFDATAKTITGVFGYTYLVGQYILIQGSTLNDGVLKIASVADGKITVEDDLLSESTGVDMFGLAPTRDFLALVNEIAAYTSKDGVKSESIDDYSVSYETDGSWRSAFRKRLNAYRSITSDLEVLKYGDYSVFQFHNQAL